MDCQDLSRNELIALVQALQEEKRRTQCPQTGAGSRFLAFGEREEREFEQSPYPIRIFDHETLRYLAVNDAALKLYGYTRKEFLELSPLDTRHPDELEHFRESLRESTGYLRFRSPRRHVLKNGRIISVEVITQDIVYKGREARLSLTLDITRWFRIQEQLHYSEGKLAALLERAPDAITRFDRQLRYIYANPAASAWMELPKTALVNRTARELKVPQPLAELWEREVVEVFRSGAERSVEFECPCHGEIRNFEARLVPEPGPDGAAETVLAISRDITAHKRAEKELRQQKKLLDDVIEHLPVGVTVKDANSRQYILRNRMAEQLTGFSRMESRGKCAEDIWPPDFAQRIAQTEAEALSRGAPVSVPFTRPGASLHGRIIRNTKVPVPDEAGNHSYLVSILEDLTNMQATHAALRRSETRLNQLISKSPAVIYSFALDPPLATTYVSENITAQTGWQPSDFTADRSFWLDHVHPDDWSVVAQMTASLATEGRYSSQYRFRHKDGSWHWMHDEGQVLREEDASAEGIGIWMDITSQRDEAEERLQQALRQRDALVREIHHRIKNHLQGMAGLLLQAGRANPDIASLIDTVVAQMKSVALVYGLQGGTTVALGPVLAAICASLENLVPCRILRKWDVHRQGTLHLDANEAVPIAVAVNELVFNAVKHGQRVAGKVIVEVDYAESGPRAEIRITNRGTLPVAFNYKTGSGCGMGLELVKTLLGPKGNSLAIWPSEGMVQTTLVLENPLVLLTLTAAAA